MMKHALSTSTFRLSSIFMLSMVTLLFSSCVTLREYESLQSQYSQAVKGWNLSKQELQELREENAELVRQGQSMTVAMSDLAAARQ